MESSATLFIGSFFVLFSPWGELPTGWSVGGSYQDPTCRNGAGTGEAKREELVSSKVKANLTQPVDG